LQLWLHHVRRCHNPYRVAAWVIILTQRSRNGNVGLEGGTALRLVAHIKEESTSK